MKKSKLAIVLCITLLLMSLGLAGCSGGNEAPAAEAPAAEAPATETPASEEGYVIGFSNYSLGNSWRPQMEAEFMQRADELKAEGVISEYFMTNSNDDISTQIADMKDLITKGCDAILITAASPDALSPVVEEAMDAGIVVVSFDNYVTTDNVTSKVGIDEVEFGAVGGQWLVDSLDGNGDIIVLNGVAGTAVDAMRYEGAKAAFDAAPGINILGEVNANWDYAEGKRAMEGLMSAFPNIDGVWTQGGAMTHAALDAFVEAGRPLVPMAGEANNGLLIAWAENAENGFDSICPSSPTYMSADALDVAISALNGEQVSPQTVLELPFVTSATLDEYVRPDLPDSFWVITKLSEENIEKLFK